MQFVKDKLSETMRDAGKRYVSDLLAMNDEDLAEGAEGARAPLDFSYEVAYVNDRLATRFRGEDPGPFAKSEGGWVVCPEEHRSKEAVAKLVEESTERMASAFAKVEDLSALIPVPGSETSMLDIALLGCIHLNYHDGQLNYLQSMRGDNEIHWS